MEKEIPILKIKAVEISDYLKNLSLHTNTNVIVSDSIYFINECNILFFKSLVLNKINNSSIF